MDVPTDREISEHKRLSALYDASEQGTKDVMSSELHEHFDDAD